MWNIFLVSDFILPLVVASELSLLTFAILSIVVLVFWKLCDFWMLSLINPCRSVPTFSQAPGLYVPFCKYLLEVSAWCHPHCSHSVSASVLSPRWPISIQLDSSPLSNLFSTLQQESFFQSVCHTPPTYISLVALYHPSSKSPCS